MTSHRLAHGVLLLLLASSLPGQQRSFTEYSLPLGPGVPPDPVALAAGADGNMWFTVYQGNKVGKVTPSGEITTYSVPTNNASPGPITAGPDGNLWFVERTGHKIARVTTAGVIAEFSIPTAGGTPWSIAAGPDGNLWFTEHARFGNRIGRITTAGVVTEFPVPTADSDPSGIALGPDGNLWFTEYHTAKIGKITPSGVITEYELPDKSSTPECITAGPDRNLWFSDYAKASIGTITPAGVVSEVRVNGTINGMVAAKGSVWYTDGANNAIGVISTSKAITEFPLPTAHSNPSGIAVGPDGNLWFAEPNAVKIGVLIGASLGVVVPTLSAVTNSVSGAPGITGNTWITLWGTNLAQKGIARQWQESDFVGGFMPTVLDGISTTVNGANAFVYYISENQINILTPVAVPSGQVYVQVSKDGLAGAAFPSSTSQYSLAFFVFNGGPHVIAVHADGSLVGPASLFPGFSTPAKPGEVIQVYGNGFGPVPGPYTPGSPKQSGSLVPTPVITIGGTSATVQFAGLVSAGLFQFNVVVPLGTPDGDAPIVAKTGPFNGLST